MAQMSFNRLMTKEPVQPCRGKLLGSKKEQTIDLPNNMNGSQSYYAAFKKSQFQNALYASIYITFLT